MSVGGAKTDKPSGDPERPDPGTGRSRANRSRGEADRESAPPPAGPHADPSLTNPDATPGAGALQPPGAHDDVDSTSG